MINLLECPSCQYEQLYSDAYIGTLGAADWFRCRNCGMTFTQPPEEDKEKEE